MEGRIVFLVVPLARAQHGVEPREEGGRVVVRARRDGGALRIEVRDNGDGLLGGIREGTGVRNTRERLLHLYGEGRQRFDLAPDPAGGTVATVQLPIETEDGPAPSFTTPVAPTSGAVGPVRRDATPAPGSGAVHAAAFRRHTS